jgi:hypothetical protein
MRKRIAAVLVLAAVAVVALGLPTAGAPARPGDAAGPPCSDIRLTVDYTGTLGGDATVRGILSTPQALSCLNGVYTVYVYDATGTTLLGSQTFTGNAIDDAFAYSIAITNAPQTVCVYATSEFRGRIADTAPNGACSDPAEPVELNGGAGASGFG